MANYTYLTLDTLAPSAVVLNINDGAMYTTTPNVTLDISTTDTSTTGYQMKIWGIEGAETESAASWETYSPTKAVRLTSGDGLKTVHIRLRDDVYNETADVTDTITLNSSVPAVTIQSQDVTRISKVSPKNVCTLAWYSDTDFVEYKVCVVSSINAAHDSGTVIGTTGGSTNVGGSKNVLAEAVQTTKIYGVDFEAAGAISNAQSIIKIFVKNAVGTWSV